MNNKSDSFKTIKIFSKDIPLDIATSCNLLSGVKHIEMSLWQSSFIYSLIKKYRPCNVLEVGVSAGGTSKLVLGAMKHLDIKNGKLISVDINENLYNDENKKTGWQVDPQKNYSLHTGKYLPEIIESFDTSFDFCILDTVHSMPGELLDYLVILPFMNKAGIIIFHNIILHLYNNDTEYSNRILFDCAVGDKIVLLEDDKKLPNIAALKINEDTCKYIGNVIQALAMKWSYPLKVNEYNIYKKFFMKYYGEDVATWFSLARNWNESNLRKFSIDKARTIFKNRSISN